MQLQRDLGVPCVSQPSIISVVWDCVLDHEPCNFNVWTIFVNAFRCMRDTKGENNCHIVSGLAENVMSGTLEAGFISVCCGVLVSRNHCLVLLNWF